MKPEKFRIPTFMESGIIYDQPCEGTGAKIAFLERQLNEMTFHSNIEHLDAGGITRLKDGTFLIQSLEYISQLHIDYFRYGQVVARHSINQLEAKGVIPESTMLVFTIPFGTKGMMSKDVDAMQKGMYKVLSQEKISVLGSYSRCANKPAAGIMIQGFHDPKSDGLMFSLNPQPGKKKIILTKKIGTGLLFEAHKHYYLSTSILNEIIDDLLVSQLDALHIFKKHKVTQVGGIDAFGAAKVIETMLGPEQFARIHLMKIPTWSGLIPSIEQGVRTALHAQNRSAYMDQVMVLQQSPLLRAELLFDPQTAGAWIAFVEPDHADQILSDLQSSNMISASIIGDVDTTTARHKVTLVP
jgi:selenide,water dikinase